MITRRRVVIALGAGALAPFAAFASFVYKLEINFYPSA